MNKDSCKYCGILIDELHFGTKMCDKCWEVRGRLQTMSSTLKLGDSLNRKIEKNES